MGEILKFERPAKPTKRSGNSLCRAGRHRWEVVKSDPFDVKLGKLVTRYRCRRCGEYRTKSQ